MNSKVLSFFASFLSKLNICFQESLVGKAFNKLWSLLGKAFSGSFIHRFFQDDKRRENVWENSIFGKIVNLPKTFLIFLQKKLSLGEFIEKSAVCSAFSKWNLVSVRIYGVGMVAFGLATTIFRENSYLTLGLLVSLEIIGLLLVLINKSVHQLVSGSGIICAVVGIFVETDRDEKSVARVKLYHYGISVGIGLLLSAVCIYSGVDVMVILFALVFAFAFMMKYLSLSVFLTVAFSPILPTMVLVGLSFICAFVFVIHVIKNKEFTFSKSPVNVAVVFFVIALLWGVVNSYAQASSIKQVLVHGSFILFYFVLTNVIRTKKQWLALVKVFMLSAFIVAGYGLFQNFFGVSSTDSWIDEEMFTDIKLRVYSFFDNPNVLGEFLVLTIPVAVALAWNKIREEHRVIFAIFLICMVACMIFTWSRGAWLGMMIALALYLVIADKRWLVVGTLGILLIPIVLYLTGNMAIIERFTSIGNTADTSTAYRVSIWQASVNMIGDFWLSGIGIGSDAYTTIYPSYALPGAKFALHSHNLYLQFAVETGIIGIASLFALLSGFLRTVLASSVVKKIKTSDTAKILVALGVGFIGFMFQGLTDYVWYNYKILMIFWIIIALGVSGSVIFKEESKGGDSL